MWHRLEKSEASQPPIPLKKTKGKSHVPNPATKKKKKNANRLKKKQHPDHVTIMVSGTGLNFVQSRRKKYCHNLTQYWYTNITRKPKSKIRQAQSDHTVNRNLRKYVTVDIFNRSIEFQFASGSEISIVDWRTWRKLNKPTILKTDKTAKSVTGEKINIVGEVILTVTLNRVNKKLKAYVIKKNRTTCSEQIG